MIEVKLSQGAKPGKGGILPDKKVTAEIAKIRGIPIGETCTSPNSHTAISNLDQMLDFIEELAEISGLPIGIKSAIGKIDFWEELASRVKEMGQGPDFITIDGGEGGTGAAPISFTDHVSLPFKIGFKRVYSIFKKEGPSHSPKITISLEVLNLKTIKKYEQIIICISTIFFLLIFTLSVNFNN